MDRTWNDGNNRIGQRGEDRTAGNARHFYRQDAGSEIDDYIRTLASTGGYRDAFEGPRPYGRDIDGSGCPLGIFARDHEGRANEATARICPLAVDNEHYPRRGRDRRSVRSRRSQRPVRVSWWVDFAPIALLFTIGGFIGMVAWRLL